MNHQGASRAFVEPVEFVWISQIKGKMIVAPRVEGGDADSVESFRTLFVAFF